MKIYLDNLAFLVAVGEFKGRKQPGSISKIILFNILLFFLLSGCGRDVQLKNFPPQNRTICCFGDSLVYGTGASSTKESYPSVLGEITGLEVTNWGTPGDTTAQALPKCNEIPKQSFGIVIVTLGGNDILQRVR